ncbi:LysE family translocator [Segetibacter koreensis]|uniref:LysE family translocator n=1 Tax=Segetibacter koreensis TaxID=398037 RepID=UPI000377EFD9|nr:LysE family transporter [Segetibacter koreensis]
MRQLTRIFFTGMIISFLGSLPLGSLNVAAMQISITDGYTQALWFGTGILLIEIIYVRVSLVAMDKIRKHEKILKALEWVTLLIVSALAISSFVAAAKNNVHTKNILLSNSMPRFVLGLFMSAVNPVQIPFWFGWSTVLFTKKILLPRNDHYNIYITGIGLGTFLATCVFIFGGKLVVEKLNTNQHTLHLIIGGIFTATAIIQIWKMLKRKDAVEKIHNIKEEDLHPERKAE